MGWRSVSTIAMVKSHPFNQVPIRRADKDGKSMREQGPVYTGKDCAKRIFLTHQNTISSAKHRHSLTLDSDRRIGMGKMRRDRSKIDSDCY
jgi:hypothetical protein